MLCRLCCILELKTAERRFFHRVHLCIWAIGGHKLGTLGIRAHNSLTVHDNSWALKFDNFFEFQNVISDTSSFTPPVWLGCFAYKKSICDSPLSLMVKQGIILKQFKLILKRFRTAFWDSCVCLIYSLLQNKPVQVFQQVFFIWKAGTIVTLF